MKLPNEKSLNDFLCWSVSPLVTPAQVHELTTQFGLDETIALVIRVKEEAWENVKQLFDAKEFARENGYILMAAFCQEECPTPVKDSLFQRFFSQHWLARQSKKQSKLSFEFMQTLPDHLWEEIAERTIRLAATDPTFLRRGFQLQDLVINDFLPIWREYAHRFPEKAATASNCQPDALGFYIKALLNMPPECWEILNPQEQEQALNWVKSYFQLAPEKLQIGFPKEAINTVSPGFKVQRERTQMWLLGLKFGIFSEKELSYIVSYSAKLLEMSLDYAEDTYPSLVKAELNFLTHSSFKPTPNEEGASNLDLSKLVLKTCHRVQDTAKKSLKRDNVLTYCLFLFRIREIGGLIPQKCHGKLDYLATRVKTALIKACPLIDPQFSILPEVAMQIPAQKNTPADSEFLSHFFRLFATAYPFPNDINSRLDLSQQNDFVCAFLKVVDRMAQDPKNIPAILTLFQILPTNTPARVQLLIKEIYFLYERGSYAAVKSLLDQAHTQRLREQISGSTANVQLLDALLTEAEAWRQAAKNKRKAVMPLEKPQSSYYFSNFPL